MTRRRGSGKLDLERKLLQSDGKARQRLIPSTSLDDEGQPGRRAMCIPRGDLDAGGIIRLERRSGRRSGSEAANLVGARRPRGPQGQA